MSDKGHRQGELRARPGQAPAAGDMRRGTFALGLGGDRDALLHVPAKVAAGKPAPLLVLFHGAGGRATQLVDAFAETAAARGYMILAPESQGRTWDVILGGYGADVAALDGALAHVFERYAVDPARVAAAGFSDGASYALSVGITNGALVKHILAFSPGFMAPTREEDRPRVFVSHGTQDAVLPIDACSRRLVPALRNAGYDVDYREFEGGHMVPPDMASAAVARFLS